MPKQCFVAAEIRPSYIKRVLSSFLSLYLAQCAVSATALDQPTGSNLCTATKIIQFDEPDLDWRHAEQLDRQKYVNHNGRVLRPSEFEDLYQQPHSVDRLLRNLKVVVDADLLIQPNFFNDANIKRAFGATSVSWTRDNLGGDATLTVGTITFDGTLLPSAQGNARLMQKRERDGRAYYVGAIDLELTDDGIPVSAISQVFGPPQQALPDCIVGMASHVIQKGDCKGVMSYDYSKEAFDSAYLAVNKLELSIRKEVPERKPLAWTPRTVKGSQRFLCDEDHVQKLTIMQQGHL